MNTYYVVVPRNKDGNEALNLHKGDGQIYFDFSTAETHREKLPHKRNMEVVRVEIIRAKEESGG